MEFDLDKALEEVPIHIEDPPFPSIRQEKRSSGFISDLPSEEGRKLEHFTKLRPKRAKKQQSTHPAVGGLVAPPCPPPGKTAESYKSALYMWKLVGKDIRTSTYVWDSRKIPHLVLNIFRKENARKFSTLSNKVALLKSLWKYQSCGYNKQATLRSCIVYGYEKMENKYWRIHLWLKIACVWFWRAPYTPPPLCSGLLWPPGFW